MSANLEVLAQLESALARGSGMSGGALMGGALLGGRLPKEERKEKYVSDALYRQRVDVARQRYQGLSVEKKEQMKTLRVAGAKAYRDALKAKLEAWEAAHPKSSAFQRDQARGQFVAELKQESRTKRNLAAKEYRITPLNPNDPQVVAAREHFNAAQRAYREAVKLSNERFGGLKK